MSNRPRARRSSALLALAALSACLVPPASGRAADAGTDAAVADDASSAASGRRGPAAVFDVLILRPTGLAVLTVGFNFFLPAVIVGVPIPLIADGPRAARISFREAWDRFVVSPASYTFRRPIGDF